MTAAMLDRLLPPGAPVVEVTGLSKRYGRTVALDDVTCSIGEHSITGLLGRNAAGKTTLMGILTGQAFATSGVVRLFGQDPLENDRVLAHTCFIRENQQYPSNFRVGNVFDAAAHFHPLFDRVYAESLADEFDLPRRRQVHRLSRGQRSAVGIIVGLAAQAPLTLFDEPYLGLDATARQLFYDRLLADYAERPRTIVLSTHLIDEVSNLLDAVIVVDRGRLVVADDVENLRGSATTLMGREQSVDDVAAGHPVLHRERMGMLASVTVQGAFGESERRRAAELSVDLQPVSLQQLVMRASAAHRNGGTQ